MMTLITGGGGFIGVRLAARLRAEGERVALFDRRFETAALAGLPGDVETIEGDVTSFDSVHQAIASVHPDGVVHLAAILSGQCEGDPVLAFAINVGGTFNALEAARREGVKKLVATSSAAVYEAPDPAPPLDEDAPLAPISVYGMTKTVGEEWCRFYYRRHGLDARIARPGAVVGPGRVAISAASSWTTALIEEPLRGRPYVCPVAEDDSSALVYHTDLTDGLARLYLAERVPSRVYNLGSCAATAGELARLVRERVPDARISYRADPIAGFVVGRWRHVVQDFRRASQDLGWRPRCTTAAGLVAACADEVSKNPGS